ncbi:MAG: YidC/Oxa1 family membrane protein insertase, partial [Clostridia bacterium]|nr:YidC/Oxa1 family membrane protein insertase [Clostridia bacterium]
MSFGSILSTVFIGPLKLLFEIIFQLADRFVEHPGFSIIFLSLVMNILVLPLYRRADAMQEAARDMDMKLRDGVAHIKKVFTGDEKMMILQTYYRQNNYKPTDALNGSVSLLLEIPFFMAAYQFLSHLEVLQGVSLGPIKDLGAPDGMLVIGGIAINVLPILMTLINVISSALYLKGFPLKTKIQLYGIAAFFLVFLYTSPAGLVFYWTLNNVFSLVKNIFYKLKNPRRVLNVLTSLLGIASAVFGAFIYDSPSLRRRVFLVGLGIALQLPAILALCKGRVHLPKAKVPATPNRKMFVWGALFLTVLVGLLIPSNFIAASPQEYVDITYFHNPLW